jgi:hypothetical protein
MLKEKEGARTWKEMQGRRRGRTGREEGERGQKEKADN